MQAALVWILDQEGLPRGAGVLIGRRRVLTCAHVVVAARDRCGQQALSSDPAHVHVVQLGQIDPIPARLDAQNWFEPGPNGPGDPGDGDLAVLELEQDTLAGAAPVGTWVAGPDHGLEIAAFGLPANHDAQGGGWAGGHLAGTQASGWVQIDGKDGGYQIQPGFSGAPAWSEEVRGVVGLIVAAELDQAARVGWMIPTSVVANRIREIEAIASVAHPEQGVPDSQRNSVAMTPSERLAFDIQAWVEGPNEQTRREWNIPESDHPWTLYVRNCGDHSVENVRVVVTDAEGGDARRLPSWTRPLVPGGPDNDYVLRDALGDWFACDGARPVVTIEFTAFGRHWRKKGGELEALERLGGPSGRERGGGDPDAS
jgi:hypothetical protein